jgi:glycosyltransferase involved in cell wall biosynthesis
MNEVKDYISQNIALVIPVFNEEEILMDVLMQLTNSGYRVICVDDASTDDSNRIIKLLDLEVITHIINRGQGAAIETGFEYLRRDPRSTKYVFTFDADGQHSMLDIPKMFKLMRDGNFDIVLGSRFLDNTSNVPRIKKVLLKVSVKMNKVFSGLNLSDRHNGFRCLKISMLDLFRITEDGFAHADEFLRIIRVHKLKYAEAAVTISYTDYSKSKGQPLVNIVNLLFDKIWRTK